MRERKFELPSLLIVIQLLASSVFSAENVPELKLFRLTGPALHANSAAAPDISSKTPRAITAFELRSPRDVPLELAVQRYETMNGAPLLSAPALREDPGGGAYGFLKSNVFDPITMPEVIKMGKVHLTGGLVSAVKTKNPFCLLNPLIFAVDW